MIGLLGLLEPRGPDGQGWTRMNLTIVAECGGNYDQDASKR
jgi:hypothetical protein